MSNYGPILDNLLKAAEDESIQWDIFKAKHPRKAKSKGKPSFWKSLHRQLEEWLGESVKRFPVPFTEKQARYVDKRSPGAYVFIRDERRKAGYWSSHSPKCPVANGKRDDIGLVITGDNIIACAGCDAELGKLYIELPDLIDLDVA